MKRLLVTGGLGFIGWTARYSFAKGLAETIEWYMEHPAWLRQGDRH